MTCDHATDREKHPCVGCGLFVQFILLFLTSFTIRGSGALQQTFCGSPPSCPVLGFPPRIEWKACKLQVLPNVIDPLFSSPASQSKCSAIYMAKQHSLWQFIIGHPGQMAKPSRSPMANNI